VNSFDNRRRRFLKAGAAFAGAPLLGVPLYARADTEVVRVGQSAVFSGPSASLGLELQQGINACFAECNRAGGIAGRTFQLISRDDGYEPNRSKENTIGLIGDDKVFALLGYFGTATSAASMPVFSDAKVPFIGAYSGAKVLRNPVNPFVFNIRASYEDEAGPLVRALAPMSNEKVAIFYQNDAYGMTVRDVVIAALKERGLAPVALATVERNSVDVTQAVKVLSKSGANAIAMGSLYAPSSALVKALKAQDLYFNYGSVSAIGTTDLLALGGDTARGIAISQVMPFPETGALPIVNQYKAAMAANKTPNLSYASIEGYITGRTFLEAYRRSGVSPTKERLVKEMEAMRDVEIGGFPIGFSQTNHQGSKFVEMTVIGQNGTLLR
jgi:ABC-type branched-subunit amino acid transport system substrate-binding protein